MSTPDFDTRDAATSAHADNDKCADNDECAEHDDGGSAGTAALADGERLVSIECANCGTPIRYLGWGRRPRWCSNSCRSRGWELRRAARALGAEDPMPTVVREVVERTVEVARPEPSSSPSTASPSTAREWLPILERLWEQLRQYPTPAVRGEPREFASLAAVARYVRSFAFAQAPADTPEHPEWPDTTHGWATVLGQLNNALRWRRPTLEQDRAAFAALHTTIVEAYKNLHRLEPEAELPDPGGDPDPRHQPPPD